MIDIDPEPHIVRPEIIYAEDDIEFIWRWMCKWGRGTQLKLENVSATSLYYHKRRKMKEENKTYPSKLTLAHIKRSSKVRYCRFHFNITLRSSRVPSRRRSTVGAQEAGKGRLRIIVHKICRLHTVPGFQVAIFEMRADFFADVAPPVVSTEVGQI